MTQVDAWLADETLTEVRVLEEEYESQFGPLDPAYRAARDQIIDARNAQWREQLAQLEANAPPLERASGDIERETAETSALPLPTLPNVAPIAPADGQPHPVQELTARACQERDRQLLAHFYKFVGTTRQGRWALCISGGGIRSATFALGALQGLARDGLL